MASGSEPNPKSTTGSISDEEAVRLWQTYLTGGNPQGLAAFDQLYVNLLPVVVRYCRFHLRDVHLAEDVAHAVFVRLLETRPVLKSSFTGLLLRTARNMCASELGRQRPGEPVPLESLTQPDADPSGELERRDDHAAVAGQRGDLFTRLGVPDPHGGVAGRLRDTVYGLSPSGGVELAKSARNSATRSVWPHAS